MGCLHAAPGIVICTPTMLTIKQRIGPCKYCRLKNGNKRFVSYFEAWYGWTDTCLTCGTVYQDGYYREEGKRIRAENITRAKQLFANRTQDQHPKNFRKALKACL